MTRKNIFEHLADKFNLINEVKRIYSILEKTIITKIEYDFMYYKGKTVLNIVDMYTFANWSNRQRCLNTEDMMQELEIYDIVNHNNLNFNTAITYIEFALNMIFLCDKAKTNQNLKYSPEYYMLTDNIISILNNLNMEFRYFEKDEKIIVVEKSKEATAVAEIVDDKLGDKVIEYNHYLLKGDIAKKKDILNTLASKLELEKKKLEMLDETLSDNVFYLFNNINIRHNNKEKIAKISDKELEEWYDETYQLALLAILLLDNIPRTEKIKDLKSKIENK